MQNESIECPQCKQNTLYLKNIINKEDGQSYLQTCCPNCGYVFKQKKSWSQLSRVIAIIVFIPSAMFLAVFASVIFEDNFFLPDSPIFVVLAIAFILILYFWFVRHQRNLSSPSFVLGEEYRKYKSGSTVLNEGNNKEEINFKPSNDPLMDKIRLDSIDQIEKGSHQKTDKKNLTKFWRIVVAIVIIALTVLTATPRFLELRDHFNQSNLGMREMIIETRAQGIMIFLDTYSEGFYPQELPVGMINSLKDAFKEDNDKMDKKYFGEIIDIEDFIYTSTGDSYRLCIKDSLGGKCWRK
jgi:hypothetical protein